jgi:hypothetical protein
VGLHCQCVHINLCPNKAFRIFFFTFRNHFVQDVPKFFRIGNSAADAADLPERLFCLNLRNYM